MWPHQVSNPGPLALESDMLLTALYNPAKINLNKTCIYWFMGKLCHQIKNCYQNIFLEADSNIRETAAFPQGINESANFRFLQRLSVIFGFRQDCPWSLASCGDCCGWKIASCRDCLCDLASCRESQQEAESYGHSLQEAIFHGL